MLFTPKYVFDTRTRILRDLANGRLKKAAAFQKLIELDPEDNYALMMMAEYKKEQGDDAGAVELLWKAIELQPGFGHGYRVLADLLAETGQTALCAAMEDLWAHKMITEADIPDDLLGDEDADDADADVDDIAPAEMSEVDRIPLEVIHPLDNEPAEITARLRFLRLVAKVQETADVSRELVDEVLAEREQTGPLLIGLLRGWARDLVDDSAAMVENVLALLGEMGDPKTLLSLVEFSDIDDQEISGAAKWAIRRVIELQPQAGAKALMDVAKELSAAQRLVVMALLTRDRSIDPAGELFRALCTDGTEKLSKKDCDVFVPLAIGAILSTLGSDAAPTAKALLRARGLLLSKNAKRESEYLIDELADRLPEPLAKEEAAVPYTVYDICAGEATWEDDDEDEDEDDEALVPAPIVRPAMPGRNDDCWCGSGRKYKKCHLEADQTSAGNQKSNRSIN